MKKIFSLILITSIIFIQNSVFALEETDIAVSFNPKKLKSKLKRQYKGYELVILNNSEETVEIVNSLIQNGVNGEIAYNTVEESPGGSVGILWAYCGPLGLISFGIGWVVGLIETPILYFGVKRSNKKAKEESLLYSNIVSNDTLEKNPKQAPTH